MRIRAACLCARARMDLLLAGESHERCVITGKLLHLARGTYWCDGKAHIEPRMPNDDHIPYVRAACWSLGGACPRRGGFVLGGRLAGCLSDLIATWNLHSHIPAHLRLPGAASLVGVARPGPRTAVGWPSFLLLPSSLARSLRCQWCCAVVSTSMRSAVVIYCLYLLSLSYVYGP